MQWSESGQPQYEHTEVAEKQENQVRADQTFFAAILGIVGWVGSAASSASRIRLTKENLFRIFNTGFSIACHEKAENIAITGNAMKNCTRALVTDGIAPTITCCIGYPYR